uniref:Deoxyhypusine hydroxylase n=1 Tax=Oryza meridionalis TaxID=40149 RepID=A0A0E0FEJ3_9ORYZ
MGSPAATEEEEPSAAFGATPEMEGFLCDRLLDASQPIAERFRALFSLRNLRGDAPRRALLQEAVLKDLSLHPIVRHEAAEALGAIGLEKSISLLEESLSADPAVEVKETCELALRRIEEQKNTSGAETEIVSPFLSVDPALPAKQGLSVEQLRELLLNEQESMYERYAALFALRNDSGDAAVSAIIAALGIKSALLRHEVAYVLGQLQNKAAAEALSTVLKNVDEHPMVRHEAAEALGSIADQESIALLEEFAKDPEPIVSQSCEVALSMLEFERSGKSFERPKAAT